MAQILIVDDSSTMRQMLNFALSKAGHFVLEASNGIQGLECFKQQAVDLVITDINMPEMGGYALIKAIRAQETDKKVPILVLTTEGDNSKKSLGKDLGATGWIVKPFQPQALLDVLPRVLP